MFRVKLGNVKDIIKYLECIKNKLHHACIKMILTQFKLFEIIKYVINSPCSGYTVI